MNITQPPYTPSERREIYFTAYCCLDGEECELTLLGLCRLLTGITERPVWESYQIIEHQFHELMELRPDDAERFWFVKGSPGWPQRREILIKAIEGTYKK
jgi:hypothetical protein